MSFVVGTRTLLEDLGWKPLVETLHVYRGETRNTAIALLDTQLRPRIVYVHKGCHIYTHPLLLSHATLHLFPSNLALTVVGGSTNSVVDMSFGKPVPP